MDIVVVAYLHQNNIFFLLVDMMKLVGKQKKRDNQESRQDFEVKDNLQMFGFHKIYPHEIICQGHGQGASLKFAKLGSMSKKDD